MKRLSCLVSLTCLLFIAGCSKPPVFEVEGEVVGEDGLKNYTFQTARGEVVESVTIEFVELDSKDKETTNRYQADLQELGLFKFNEKLPARTYGVVVLSNIKGKMLEKMSMASAGGKAKAVVTPTSRRFLINLAAQNVTPLK